MPGPALKALLI